MTDDERERQACWKLEQCGFNVRRQVGGEHDGWWVIEDKMTGRALASVAELDALVEVADALFTGHLNGREKTPSA